jgi:hypothetical protein
MPDHRANYKPGFAQDQIPVPLPWFNKVAPWAILALGFVVWAIVLWWRFH